MIAWPAASLVAVAGLLSFMAAYYLYVRSLLRSPEYGTFAGLCASLAVFSFATAQTMGAVSPADAAGWQRLQGLGLCPAMAYVVEFTFSILPVARSSARADQWMRGAMRVWVVVALIGVSSGLFFDPAVTDVRYDWGVAAPTNRAIGGLTLVGQVLSTVGLIGMVYAQVQLVSAALSRPELRVAAAVALVGIAIGTFDFFAGLIGVVPTHLSTYGLLLPVLGFSYVLVGRFTGVETALASTTRELAASYDHLRETQASLVKTRQLATVGELSAVIAHEIRNPLAILKNAVAGLGRDSLAAEDEATLLEILDQETDRTGRLVDDLLAYAKPILPGAGQVDLRTLVMRAVELAAGGSRDIAHVEIELELEQEVAIVEGDEALLRHALINIVDNALQAMPGGGTLTVSCRNLETAAGRPAVAVDFHDTGEGMDTLVRSRARDPFFTTRRSGTGLGLAIVDRVAQAHGGQVEIESRHGQGSTVSFVVPVERGSWVPEPG